MKIQEITQEYVVINSEKMYFDEPLKDAISLEDIQCWLENVANVLEKISASETKRHKS